MKKILKSGFTLLELLIVIVILGLLVSLVSINVLPTLSKAYSETARVDISRIEQALVMYKINEGNYPSEDEGISKLVEGGYLNKIPKDTWGNEYFYKPPENASSYEVYSLGADAKEGGDGENADISSITK